MSIQVNLIPDILLQRRREAQLKRYITSAFLGWVGLLLLIGLIMLGVKGFTASRLENSKKQFAQRNAEVNSPDNMAFREQAKQVQLSLDSLSTLFAAQELPSDLLVTLSANLPKDIIVQELAVQSEQIVIFSAFADSYAKVSATVSALETSAERTVGSAAGYFTNISLSQVSSSDVGEYRYSVTAQYVPRPIVEDQPTTPLGPGEPIEPPPQGLGDPNAQQ